MRGVAVSGCYCLLVVEWRCRVLAVECRVLAIECWVLAVECWELAVECWVLAVECWELAVECWVLAVNCRCPLLLTFSIVGAQLCRKLKEHGTIVNSYTN